MKQSVKSLSAILFLLIITIVFSANSTLSARDYYQIKVYTIKDAAQETAIDNYLKNAYIPAMHRAGVKNIGVFKPIESDPAVGTKIFVFIPLKEPGQIEKIEDKLLKDKQFQTDGTEYINAKYDNPPFERIESILLKAFKEKPEYSIPEYNTPRSEQIYELRSYQSATEKIAKKKVEMFNEGGEVDIFRKVGSNAVFYGEVLSGAAMPNLMYMTSYSDMESNNKHWEAFRDHPDWKTLSGKEEYKNTVSHIDKWLCHPTDYSDI